VTGRGGETQACSTVEYVLAQRQRHRVAAAGAEQLLRCLRSDQKLIMARCQLLHPSSG
jgi:hypothetical protein